MINYIEEINKTNLTEQTKFRLSKIIGIESYFYQEINERESYIKKLKKYITIFDYLDKILIVLSTTSGGISIISFTTIVGAPVEIASANFTLFFSISKVLIKILLKKTRNKKRKHNNISILAKSKLNIVETLISQVLNDMEISHKEFTTILKEKFKYERMKYNLESINERQ